MTRDFRDLVTLNITGESPILIDERTGKWLDLDTPEGRKLAKEIGLVYDEGPLPDWRVGNTPLQEYLVDPNITDPRPIRRLNPKEEEAMRFLIEKEAWAATAGFEMWRGSDRYIYVDVLGFYPEEESAPEGPLMSLLDRNWIFGLRMVGNQLALRVMDPSGKTCSP